MDAQDIGPTVTQIWGDDDYEFWVLVPPASVSKLAFELLQEKFSGQLGRCVSGLVPGARSAA